jgi:TolB protein
MLTRGALVFAAVVCALSTALLGGAVAAGSTWLRGEEIAYVSYRELNPDIYITDLAHDLTYNLTRSSAYDVTPAWSPDGKWIAFASDRDGRRNIYVTDVTGKTVRRLTTEGDGIYSRPQWSPNGDKLIFITLNEAPNGIYSIDFDGSNFVSLLDEANASSPLALDLAIETGSLGRAQSPDGSQYAFMTYREAGWGIYLTDHPTRRDARLLVRIGHPTEAPVWSPDGRHMAYIAQINGIIDLYIIAVDAGSPPRRLTATRSFEASPSWRP